MPKTSKVDIILYDLLGREADRLVSSEITAGRHTLAFQNNNLSSGIYFVRMTSGSYHKIRKVVLIK
ncbi:MAG: T9SS type A sorting domain-containing protein [Candidatus Electryonea clarkiae]|nr:T9SS type A sorting domain-containing protein [Candidatus Electryonea clarkiae]MDP8288202.1 T9SS type A sorting domain-containing protein [Candidatus Electryonea clarkiae]